MKFGFYYNPYRRVLVDIGLSHTPASSGCGWFLQSYALSFHRVHIVWFSSGVRHQKCGKRWTFSITIRRSADLRWLRSSIFKEN